MRFAMQSIVNVVVGFIVALRALAVAAVPSALVVAIYLSFVYLIWGTLLTKQFRHHNTFLPWLLSVISIVGIIAVIFGLHELGRVHRRSHLVKQSA